MRTKRCGSLLGVVLLLGYTTAFGQAVSVTARLDTNSLAAGGSTVLHVFAQVVPGLRPTSDRIFSYYVDVVNTNGTIATANFAAMTRPFADNDPLISSNGVSQGPNRRGIFDTFLNLPGAGVNSPVELLRIPITAQSGGRTRFVVSAGSGVPVLAADFLVALSGGADPVSGGDYSQASADLQVTGGGCVPELHVAVAGGGASAQLSFTPCAGRTHFVETRAGLGDVAGWQVLPGAPHNSGSVTVAVAGPNRFYRLRVTNP